MRRVLLCMLILVTLLPLTACKQPPSIAYPLDSRESTRAAIERYWNEGDFERFMYINTPGERREGLEPFEKAVRKQMSQCEITGWEREDVLDPAGERVELVATMRARGPEGCLKKEEVTTSFTVQKVGEHWWVDAY